MCGVMGRGAGEDHIATVAVEDESRVDAASKGTNGGAHNLPFLAAEAVSCG